MDTFGISRGAFWDSEQPTSQSAATSKRVFLWPINRHKPTPFQPRVTRKVSSITPFEGKDER